jgi:hypothetical protein
MGGGDAHDQGGDAQGGGRGDARASCASPLGTPLTRSLYGFLLLLSRFVPFLKNMFVMDSSAIFPGGTTQPLILFIVEF